MKNRIYISLPISGRDMEDVESAIKSAAAQIEKHGFKAVSPLEVSPDPESSYAVHIGAASPHCLNAMRSLSCQDGWNPKDVTSKWKPHVFTEKRYL